MKKGASGIDAEYMERYKAMVDILERMSECEIALESKKRKKQGNKKKGRAEEMWSKAKEGFGKTRRQRREENEEFVTHERKKRGNSDVMKVVKWSLGMTKEQDQARKLRERKLTLMENQLQWEEDFTQTMMEQQQ